MVNNMRMKRLDTSLRLILVLFSVALAENLLGQEPAAAALSGSGTENDPYQITSVADWNAFADAVNGGYSYNNEYLKLTADITLAIKNTGETDKMVGTVTKNNNQAVEEYCFSGIFDGDWHTIIFNVGNENTAYTPANTVFPSAPFIVIDGATINNLKVTGTIYASNKYNSGLVGYAWKTKSRDNYINNCTSSIVINCSGIAGGNPDCSSAGFLAENKNGKIHFTYCIFTGTIDKGSNTGTQKSAGFVSYNGGTSASFTNCTMAGTITIESNIATFNRNGKDSYSKAYYITNYSGSSPQGTPATTTEPTDDIAKIYTVSSTNYYVPGAEITGMTTTYSYIEGSPVEIIPVVTYYGKTLARGIDYIIKVDGTEVPTETIPTLSIAGDHTVTIEGKTGSSYAGSQTKTIHVVSYNTWDAVKAILADDSEGDRNITLSADIFPENPSGEDVALEVNGNVVLNLNDHKIDRKLYKVVNGEVTINTNVAEGYAIHVNSSAKLIINGSGIITGGNNYGNGGGIYNEGDLILNNVTVEYNNTERVDSNITGTGGGIYSESGSSLIINNGYISNNNGKGGGGGIHSKGHPCTMKNVEVCDNISEDKGGGIRVAPPSNKTDTIIGCYIHDNHTTDQTESKGGGVYMQGSTKDAKLYMEDCVFVFNTAYVFGGAFYSIKGITYAKNCTMSECLAYNETGVGIGYALGGSIYLYASSASSHDSEYTMYGGEISKSIAEINGGGVYVCEGAIFNVLGNVKIYDNIILDWDEGMINNSVYLDGTALIHVVGSLEDDAIINVVPHVDGGAAVEFAQGASSGDPEKDLSHFVIDNNDEDDYGSMIVDDEVVVYEVTSWDDPTMWDGTIASDVSGDVPTSSEDVTINRTVKIPNSCVAEARDITFGTYGSIIIEDGGQLINNNSVAVVAKKNVVAANAEAQSGWYLISSPVNNPAIAGETPATNLITTGSQKYDLYRFNESAELQWENYRASHADFTTLENGRGYLYRNKKAHTIDIGGTLNVSNVSYNLSYTATVNSEDNVLKGFNLIGNPFSHTIYKGADGSAIPNGAILEEKYYVLEGREVNDEMVWDWYLNNDGTAIPPMTGILVQAKSAGTLTIANSTSGASGSKGEDGRNIWFTVANSNYMDEACVEFKKGHGLNKIDRMNANAPMLYIRHNGEDFASVDMDEATKAINLYFKAKTTGYYTLSVKLEGEYGYLHLIDKLAGKDVDLLTEKEYSFIGSSADNADRFIVRLENTDSSENSTFAYQSGNEIVVSGEGELQVFDVMGRMVATRHINGVQTINLTQTGVYIFRLDGQTQKIVVR